MAGIELWEGTLKSKVIDFEIERRIRPIMGDLWPDRKSRLSSMKLMEVLKIANEIRNCTPSEAMELIVAEISGAESNPQDSDAQPVMENQQLTERGMFPT